MIIKGKSRTDGAALGGYLLNDKNDRVTVIEAFGHDEGHSLQDILTDFERTAEGSQCEQPLYHVQIRTPEGERLTRDQWIKTADRLQEALKMEEHERVIVFHEFEGHEHAHIVFNRMNPETGKAALLSHDGYTRMQVAREMERELGLRQLSSERTGRLSAKEEQQARRRGKDPLEIKEQIKTAWEHAENGQEFAANLSEYGYTLARGDRRDYLAVDRSGHYYAVGRVVGEKADAVREKLHDTPREQLPNLDEAQEEQRKRGGLSYDEEQKARWSVKKQKEIKAAIRECWQQSQNGQELSAALEQHGFMLAKGERENFVVVDRDGHSHAVGRVVGEKADAVRDKLHDIIKLQVLDLDEAQEKQLLKKEMEKAQTLPGELYRRGGMEFQQRDAVRHIEEHAKSKRAARENKERRSRTALDALQEGRTVKIRTAEDALREEKEGRTEQTDRKRGRTALDVLRETSEGRAERGGRDRDDEGGRERERERE